MTTTIRDLADKLHISITTVSKALNGYTDIAEDTRQRVLAAADELGYVPSFTARQLRRQRTDAIGFIVPTNTPQFGETYYLDYISGICDEAVSQQFDVLVTSAPPQSEAEKNMYQRWVQSHRVDGMVINRARLQDWRIHYLAENAFPFVCRGKGDAALDYPFIDVDDTGGFRQMVGHLVQQGHHRIALIGASPDLIIQMDRLAGYRQGLEASNIPFDHELVIEGDLSEESGYRGATELLNRPHPPTAILCIRDLVAMGALRAATEKGLIVGQDIAISGYDGIKETEFTNPPLSTIYQPTYEIARQLTQMVIQLIRGESIADRSRMIEPRLVIRESTGPKEK